MIKNILIFGSNGFIGNNIFQKLKKNFKVDTISRKNATFCFDLSKEKIELKKEYDLVIHCAGIAHGKLNSKNFNDCISLTENFLNSFSKTPKILLFLSSVSVYGLKEGSLISENNQIKPIDLNGKAKAISEKIILNWTQANSVQCTILRLPLVVGKNSPGNFSSMVNAIKKKYFFTINNGLAKKSMVCVECISNNIINLSSSEGIFNITDAYHPSFFEIINEIKLALKINYNSLNFNLFFIEIFSLILPKKIKSKLEKLSYTLTFDDSKARKNLMWKSKKVLNEIKKIV